MENPLIWKEEDRRIQYSCKIFSVGERICRSPENKLKTYMVLDASDWAIVVPVLESRQGREFVMVKQWRPGEGQLSLEFPGGVIEQGESSEQAALRELREETAYIAGKITKLGEFNPNPAIMSNHVHLFLAEELRETGAQDLDEDEYVTTEIVPWKKALEGMGKAPFNHALMASALALYLRKTLN